MNTAVCLAVGYLLGALNPAALIARLKHQDLREQGTKNLGATNTMLTFGKGYGLVVMLIYHSARIRTPICSGKFPRVLR